MNDSKFWAKVKKEAGSACWEWRGARDKYGYGRVVRLKFGTKPLKAHRYGFYIHNGRWPDGMCAHSCGNKACVRHDHLYDDVRLAQKEKPLVDSYLEDRAKQIRERYVRGSRVNGVAGLAKQYGLDTHTVHQIVKGEFC